MNHRGLQTASPTILAIALACMVAPSAIAEEARASIITAIFPSGNQVPANHLKFYIHFSRPMRQGVFLQHCSLRDGLGNEVPEPFRETELWSEDRTRLTLWLHPGRQKTGVNLNVEFGPVLHPRDDYTLVVSGKWPAENGGSLGSDVQKNFRAVERATARLNADTWHISAPLAGSNSPLTVRFPAPLDHALLLRCIRVIGSGGQPVAGKIAIAERERSWSFVPVSPWDAEAHTLAVDSILEDLAGNSLARPFEVDVTKTAPEKRASVVAIPFRPTHGTK